MGSRIISSKYIWGLIFAVLFAIAIFFCYEYRVNRDKEIELAAAALPKNYTETQTKLLYEAEVKMWEPTEAPRSILDDIRYIDAKNGKVQISSLGSSVTQGAGSSDPFRSWGPIISRQLRSYDDKFINVNFTSNGFGGYTTGNLLNEGKVEEIIKQNPDFILFETCLLNEHGQNVPLDTTINNIKVVTETIKSSLPNAKVIYLTSSPRKAEKENELGLYYKDYVSATKEFIESNGWHHIDIYNGFMESGADLNELIKDDVHPNDSGYLLWAEVILDKLEEKYQPMSM